jgi:hypothetical protein
LCAVATIASVVLLSTSKFFAPIGQVAQFQRDFLMVFVVTLLIAIALYALTNMIFTKRLVHLINAAPKNKVSGSENKFEIPIHLFLSFSD